MALYDVSTTEKKAAPSLVAGGTLYADSPIGTIVPFGGLDDKIPSGWLKCNGEAISRTTYSELFAVIGTSFGEGDGSTTFNIPDMRDHGKQLGVNYIIKAKMVAVPSDFLAKVEEAVAKSITVKKGTWEGSITLQKMGDPQTKDRFDIPITFDSPMPDFKYTVVIEFFEGRYVTVRAASKTASGFHIEGANCDNNATSTVSKITWTAIRFPS